MVGRLVVLLLIANAAWFAWSQGWMRVLGLAPTVQSEPERMQRQVRPEALTLRPLDAASAAAPRAVAAAETPAPVAPPPVAVTEAPPAAAAPPAPAGICLQAGVFEGVRPVFAVLPARRVRRVGTGRNGDQPGEAEPERLHDGVVEVRNVSIARGLKEV